MEQDRENRNAEAKGRQQSLPLNWGMPRKPEMEHDQDDSDMEAVAEILDDETAAAAILTPDDLDQEYDDELEELTPAEDDLAEDEAENVPIVLATPGRRRKVTPGAPPVGAEIVRLENVEISLGQTLLEARGAANLSIAQVSQKTRIPRSFIEAVEADQYDHLPPPVYSRSYITQLCREYGLAAETLLAEYQAATGQPAVASGVRVVLGETRDEAGKLQYTPLIAREVASGRILKDISRWAVTVALALLLILVLAAFAVQQYKNYRMRHAEERLGATPASPETAIEVEELIVPQQLPMEELPVP